MKITQERLKEILTYDEVTGNFYWNIDKGKQKAGTKAGHILQSGYVLIGLDGKTYRAHHLVFLYKLGYFPDCLIDHIDGSKANNVADNLRLATKSQNAFNMKLKHNNTSGTKGVSFRKDRNKWRVYLKVNGKYISFGHFDSKSDAIIVSRMVRELHHKEFARHV